MGIESQHPQYQTCLPLWNKIRDCELGEDQVKNKREEYLPRLSGQYGSEGEAQYQGYLLRATFYNATARTVQGLAGAIFRQPTVVLWSTPVEGMQLAPPTPLTESLEKDITLSGVPLQTFIKSTVEEVLITSRYGLLVDLPQEGELRPYLAGYRAEQITYWREEVRLGRKVLTHVRLMEVAQTVTDDGLDTEEQEIYRVLDLDESGYYRVRTFAQNPNNNKEWVPTSLIEPTRLGQRLDFIPFIFMGVSDLTPAAEIPALIDLANTNLAHYRESADYRHLMHWSAIVQPWVSTADRSSTLLFGSPIAWLLNPGDQANMLTVSGDSIPAHERALAEDEMRMAKLGAELLEPAKLAAEAAETIRLRQSGRSAVLANIAQTTSLAFTQALRWCLWWAGEAATPESAAVVVQVNSEFVETQLSPQDLIALVQAWQAGGISRDTVIYNAKRGGLLPESRDIGEELDLIASETMMPTAPPENLDQHDRQSQQEAA